MGGANCCGKGLWKGARDWGQEGWGKGGGGKGWGKGGQGGGIYLNEVLNKTGIVTRLGCRNERYDTKSCEIGESPIFEGFPRCNDITFSKIRHNLAKKSPKTRRREISANYLCKKEQPS